MSEPAPVATFDNLPGTRYVLYLRSFRTDTTLARAPAYQAPLSPPCSPAAV